MNNYQTEKPQQFVGVQGMNVHNNNHFNSNDSLTRAVQAASCLNCWSLFHILFDSVVVIVSVASAYYKNFDFLISLALYTCLFFANRNASVNATYLCGVVIGVWYVVESILWILEIQDIADDDSLSDRRQQWEITMRAAAIIVSGIVTTVVLLNVKKVTNYLKLNPKMADTFVTKQNMCCCC